MRLRPWLPLALLTLLGSPAWAGPTEDLAQILRTSAASSNPALSFLRSVGDLDDAELNANQVQRALRLANLPETGALRDVLGATRRIVKRGDRIELHRSEDTTLFFHQGDAVAGRVVLKKTVKLRLTLGNRPRLDKVSGIKVGQGQDGRLYSLWKVEFFERNQRQLAAITAGAVIFSKTVEVDLTPPEPDPPTVEASDPDPEPKQGIAQALGQ